MKAYTLYVGPDRPNPFIVEEAILVEESPYRSILTVYGCEIKIRAARDTIASIGPMSSDYIAFSETLEGIEALKKEAAQHYMERWMLHAKSIQKDVARWERVLGYLNGDSPSPCVPPVAPEQKAAEPPREPSRKPWWRFWP